MNHRNVDTKREHIQNGAEVVLVFYAEIIFGTVYNMEGNMSLSFSVYTKLSNKADSYFFH